MGRAQQRAVGGQGGLRILKSLCFRPCKRLSPEVCCAIFLLLPKQRTKMHPVPLPPPLACGRAGLAQRGGDGEGPASASVGLEGPLPR